MAMDLRQVMAAFLTLSMFVMLANMIKRDHFDSAIVNVQTVSSVEYDVTKISKQMQSLVKHSGVSEGPSRIMDPKSQILQQAPPPGVDIQHTPPFQTVAPSPQQQEASPPRNQQLTLDRFSRKLGSYSSSWRQKVSTKSLSQTILAGFRHFQQEADNASKQFQQEVDNSNGQLQKTVPLSNIQLSGEAAGSRRQLGATSRQLGANLPPHCPSLVLARASPRASLTPCFKVKGCYERSWRRLGKVDRSMI